MTKSEGSAEIARREFALATHVALFEIGRQVRQPVVWIAGLIFFGFAVMVTSTDGFVGSPVVARNAPLEIAKALLFLAIFYVFVSVALAGDAALRDAKSGFEPFIKATPVSRFTRLAGRFAGFQIIVMSLYLASMTGLAVGVVAPWTDPATVGPFDWGETALAVFFIGLPAVFVPASIFFALAAWLRSTTAVYVALIVSVMAMLILPAMLKSTGLPGLRILAALEPFGLVAFLDSIRLLDPRASLTEVLRPGGLFFSSRVIGGLVSAIMLAIAFRIERREDDTRLTKEAAAAPPEMSLRAPSARRRFSLHAQAIQFGARVRLEARLLLRSPSLLILAGLLLAGAVLDLANHNILSGTPSLPATRVMADGLQGWVAMIGLIVTAFYAGEIVWRERDRRVHDLVDASPVSDGILLAAKVLAVASVLVILMLAAVLAAVLVQLGKRYFDATPDQYLMLIVVPATLQMTFLAAFAMTAAAVAPNRFAAWAATAALLGFAVTAESMGFAHPLFDFASIPTPTLSEMNPSGDGSTGFAWLSLYWGLWAGALLFVAWLFWRRGYIASATSLRARAKRRLRGPGGLVAAVLLASLAGVGGYVFVNTNVWAWQATDREIEVFMADLERSVSLYLDKPEPSIVSMTMKVDIEPSRTRLVAEGVYVLENRTGRPLTHTHLTLPSDATSVAVSVAGARSILRRDDLSLEVFAFDTPLRPGERRRLTFRTEIAPRGFGARQDRVVRNGTFVNSHELAPVPGVTRAAFLTDEDARRRQGLKPAPSMREPDAPGAHDYNYVRADLAPLDITLSTEEGQTPVAPGSAVSDTRKDGRRIIRYVSKQPIRTYFSVQSARYEVRRVKYGDVDVAVYFHPGHGGNVDRMIAAMKGGLDIYQDTFGPYQFDYLRVVEFPAYGDYGQAFAGTIPISENAGFIADLRNPRNFDYVTSLVLHEVAHQWWAHQVIGADAKGAILLSEGLAEYSAAMAQSRMQGARAGNMAMGLSREAYQEGLAERNEEEPRLLRVERQSYVGYHRAALTFVHVRLVIGEAALHRALRRFRDAHAYRTAPYPTSDDLLAAILEETPPKKRERVRQLFETRPPPLGIGFGKADPVRELE